jgi:CelD/BcsL family acetyltransferase involved in cellulose biosynthesis
VDSRIEVEAVKVAELGEGERAVWRALRGVSGLVGASAQPGLHVRHAMVADLSEGFEAYQAGRASAFLKDKRRRMRALERDHGAVRFDFGRPSTALLERVISEKRAQIRRTHQHDIFACGWTARLLQDLDTIADADFGLRLAVLRAGELVVAAELGLTSGDRHHLWFPIYDSGYARYSPGALMTLETLRVCAERGIARVDFGPSEEAYKEDFADPAEPALEGLITPHAPLAARVAHLPGGRRIAAAGTRLSRRFDRIAACEPGLAGQIKGASSLIAGLTVRHPRLAGTVGAGLGISLSLGIGLAMLAE